MQRKCLLGSGLLHGLLCIIVLFGAAFAGKEVAPPQTIEMVDPRAIPTDGPSRGGNPVTPQVQPDPTPAPQPQPEPIKQPDPTPIDPPKPLPKPDPAPVKAAPIEKPILDAPVDHGDIVVKPSPPKVIKEHKVVVDLSNKTTDLRKIRQKAEAEAREKEKRDEEAAAKAHKERVSAMRDAVRGTGAGLAKTVRSSGAPGVTVAVSGPGGGGPAFARYSSLVYDAYFRAWTAPENVSSDQSTTEALVVVARDGSIISAKVSKPSGDSALDRSVERALRKVTSLPAFPSETDDGQRTFRIMFNLEAKLSLG